MKERLYWTDSLTVGSVLKLLALQLRHRRPARIVCYDERPPPPWLTRLLRLAAILEVSPARIALGDLVNDQGVNLYWHNDELMLSAARRALSGLPVERLARQIEVPTDVLRAFLDRAVLADLHQPSLRSTMLWGNARLNKEQQHILLLPQSIFAKDLATAYRQDGIEVAFAPKPSIFWWPLREILAIGKQWLASWRPAPCDDAPGPCLVLQYVAGFDRSRVSDIAWLDASGLRRDQILVYAEPPLDKVAAEAARQNGFRFIAFDQGRSRFLPKAYRRALWQALRTGSGPLWQHGIGGTMHRVWLTGWLLRFLRTRTSWEVFFRANGAKIHLHVGDANAVSLAVTDALRRAGGVDVAFQLGGSCTELIFEHRALTNRILFAWGEFHRRIYDVIARRIPGKEPYYLIVGGNQHDHLVKLHRSKASELRDGLRRRGIRQIVVAFDNVVRRDFLISPTHLTEFYDALLEIADSDSSVAIVLKSKPGVPLSLSAAEKVRRDRLMADARWIELPAAISAFEAALHGDVVVALHINTAAMEAAIAGIPHIYYDLTAWTAHPFYALADRLIAADRPQLQQLLAWHAANSKGFWSDPALQRYRNDLCPYSDGESARRLGQVIARIFATLIAGETPNQAVNALKNLVFLEDQVAKDPS